MGSFMDSSHHVPIFYNLQHYRTVYSRLQMPSFVHLPGSTELIFIMQNNLTNINTFINNYDFNDNLRIYFYC